MVELTISQRKYKQCIYKSIIDSGVDSEKESNGATAGSDEDEGMGIPKPSHIGSLSEIFNAFCMSKDKTVFSKSVLSSDDCSHFATTVIID